MGFWQWRKEGAGRPGSQRQVGRGRKPNICGSQEPRANRAAAGFWPTDRDTCVDPRGPHHPGDCTGSSGRTWRRRRRL